MNGWDYSFWRPATPQAVKNAGIGFVCRYLCYLPNAKVINAAEYNGLRAAGLDVVLNWENNAQSLNGGASAGTADATDALAQAKALGAWPCPIYFSADWDVTEAQQANVNAYLVAAGKVLGAEYVGIYGGYYAVSRAAAAGAAKWFWQTFAWSGGLWYEGNHIRQTATGANYDQDTAMVASFGQVGSVASATTISSEDDDLSYVIETSGQPALFVSSAGAVGVPSMADLDTLKGVPVYSGLSPAFYTSINQQASKAANDLDELKATVASLSAAVTALTASLGASDVTFVPSGTITLTAEKAS